MTGTCNMHAEQKQRKGSLLCPHWFGVGCPLELKLSLAVCRPGGVLVLCFKVWQPLGNHKMMGLVLRADMLVG